MQGLRGFATAKFLDTAEHLLTASQNTLDWQHHESLVRFALSGDILASLQDLSGLQHDILQNGEAVSQVWEDGVDRCVMPSPRVFVLDPIRCTGSEYLFGEDAVDLKYKVMHFYAPDRINYELASNSRSKTAAMFCCHVLDDPVTDWTYSDDDVLPASMQSDLKGNTNFRPSDGPPPKERVFRTHESSSADQQEQWKDVAFIAEKRRRI